MNNSANNSERRIFTANVRASFLSKLSREELERKLVLALWDDESGKMIYDGNTPELEILDYEFTEVRREIEEEK